MRVLILLILFVGLGVLGLRQSWWEIPREWNPWAALHVGDPVTPATRLKLRRLRDDPTACRAALDTAPQGTLRYDALGDHLGAPGCPLENVVRVRRAGTDFSASFVASCPLALAWTLYEIHGLQPAAEATLGTRVRQVEHYGSFACRNIYHRENARRSEHATAEALDVAGFRFEDGRRVSVLRDWNSEGEDAPARFLRAARDAACRFFGNTLGPEYNAAHANHFHLGMRGFGLCR
ncbi:extensin family protein [Verticiella sediminum]|uniref:Extensin family protein n=1 Tax=Verticiella sediminum TaxID=1247510 RepID=A0A556AQ08_9BURK|nr:extensin family protein [Verticiella sediminum]TSH94988.1 extensin family protein [Verticiella sediminum]